MPNTALPILGVALTQTVTASDITAGNQRPFAKLGQTTNGSDGKLYVYAIAGGSITGSTATCSVNSGTFTATSSGGSYTSPSTTMGAGDYGWFSKALV